MTLVITSTDTLATDIIETETVETVETATVATETIAPIDTDTDTDTDTEATALPVITLDHPLTSADVLATLANKGVAPTSKLLNSIKSVITGGSATIALDCTLSAIGGAYQIDLADHPMKKELTAVENPAEEVAINLPKPASNKLTAGKRYLQNLSIVASMIRATRDLHNVRSVICAIDSKKNEGRVDLVICYTESVETIALKVATYLAPCSHTRLSLFNALLTLANVAPIETTMTLAKLPNRSKMNLIKAPVKTAL